MSQGQQQTTLSAGGGAAGLADSAVARVAEAVGELELAEPRPRVARQIGRYHLVHELGTGGMGVVYLAEQTHPIKRTIALKLIKPGMDSGDVMRRFEAERQALAMMNHRNVARVLDAGTSDDGRPYFVMEHVPGLPITHYCDAQRLTLRQRLELFLQACEAVQHAHQKAIIHRDLKPGNILVTGENGDAEVKVIDFGVAKALSPTLDQQQTLYTQAGQMLGTPDYMSPEQAGSEGHVVDTRSDIYSLGVVLYELLAGALPFDPRTLRSSGTAEIQRILREVNPPRPCARLSSVGEAAGGAIASNRGMQVHELARQLRGELGWIPLKAMRKEPEQRYGSVGELAEDIRNYLHQRPLVAGPESRRYRLRKFVRRNRKALAVAVAFAVLLSNGIALYIRGMRAEQAKTLSALEEANRANAALHAVNDFFTMDVIGAADPAISQGRELTVREALDRAAENISAELLPDPIVEAKLRLTVADAYGSLGKSATGLEHVRIARQLFATHLGKEHPHTLTSMSYEAGLLRDLGELARAEDLYRELLELQRRVLGEDDRNTLTTIGNLAGALKGQGKLADAEPLNREVLARARKLFGPDHHDSLVYLNNLAHLLWLQQKHAEAEPLFRESLDQSQRLRGPDHPLTLLAMNNLGNVLRSQQRLDEAEPLFRASLAGSRRVRGEDHPETLTVLMSLGDLLSARGDFAGAALILQEAVERAQVIWGEAHPVTNRARDLLAAAHEAAPPAATSRPSSAEER